MILNQGFKKNSAGDWYLYCFDQINSQKALDEIIEKVCKQDLESLLSYKPSSVLCQPIYQIGKKCLLDQKSQQALSIFAVLVVLRPDLENVWLGLAMVEEQLNRLDDAREIYKHVLKINFSQVTAKKALERLK